jgi:Tfp pilus assembly protein PilV
MNYKPASKDLTMVFQKHKQHAFTLIECLVMVLILMVSISGILSFRYHAILNAERAETQLLAARAATVLSEGWRASKGAADLIRRCRDLTATLKYSLKALSS